MGPGKTRGPAQGAHLQTSRLLVALNGGGVALKANDLANQVLVAHAHELVHRRARDLVCHHHGARHLLDNAALPLRGLPVASHGDVVSLLQLPETEGLCCGVVGRGGEVKGVRVMAGEGAAPARERDQPETAARRSTEQKAASSKISDYYSRCWPVVASTRVPAVRVYLKH